ncbi:MAG: MBL fold metallo-hydrolase [Pirellulales bacterium]|nr:MBL fold metallo-hydrolase [Thermoguttaceae bacterium]MDD4786513.1 MBL fold metallo-hydrolase [Pirellulales bacterium]MDI9444901.1 MBL fold metallo-hydrolase [Planctomycetota bacterium]NLY99188.1 MBL fold metallo-hydrolase [Pirellulaceae bacterium]
MTKTRITRRAFVGSSAIAAAAAHAWRTTAVEAAEPAMKLTILGDSSCIPDAGHEAACFVINGKHLVDTGWCAALKMRQYGFDPLNLESIILTHFHQDHYVGLPQLLFYIGLKKRQGPPLLIIGPNQHLERVVRAAVDFLQIDRFPELAVNYRLVPLAAGDRFELPGLRCETFAARHVSGKNQLEQALVYKMTDEASGARLAFTGDTHHHPPIADFVQGVPLLIHDGGHTQPKEAADIAKRAGVGRLVLIHYQQKRGSAILAKARAVFPSTELAQEGVCLEVPPAR